MSDNLTPTAHAILDTLREHPATAADLRDLTGRSRSTIDKALNDLTKAGLITRTTLRDADTDGPTPWALTDPDPADTPTAARPSPEEEVKVCRGCGEQMPKICPACASKTTSYCGTCRKTQPTRRRAQGEPQILANGLPKLLPGQLEHLVADVITSHPLPDHLGITGWTPGRVAVFLPGRSTGAIANALDKLAATNRAHLIGDNPKRYQPTPDPQPTGDDADPPHNPDDSDRDQ